LVSPRLSASSRGRVFITGRRQAELDAAVKQIGKNVTAVQSDVSNLADLDRLYATVKKEKGHLDIVFAQGSARIQRLQRN
jgi:NADP-dependent 3-hydroxy acid dehydrogenase YdfG